MPSYLYQLAYTSESWGAQIRNPQNRVEQVRPMVEKLGGRFQSVFYAFGDYDIVAIVEFPDNESAAAFALAVQAGGAVKTAKTTPLMAIEEGLGAMRKAATASYRPPGS